LRSISQFCETNLIKALRLSPCIGAIPSPSVITLSGVSFCAPPFFTYRGNVARLPLLSSRRGYPEQQQQPLLVVKVELDEYEDGKVALCLSNLIASLSHSHNLIITNFLIIFHSHNISIQCVQNILRGHPHQVPLRHRRRM